MGFVLALVIGGGAGAAIKPVAGSMAPAAAVDSRPPEASLGRVDVEAVQGTAQALSASGDWVKLELGSRLRRPLKLRTVGHDAHLTVTFQGVRLVAEHEAIVMLSAPGPQPSVLVQQGHARVFRSSGDLAVFVPDREVKLLGQTFGVWVREEGVAVAVLDGELEVKAPGRKPMKFARGRELVLAERVVPAVLDQQLEIQVQGTSRRGSRYTLTARTAPHALVVHTDDNGARHILPVSPAGAFSVDLLDRRPQPGQLVAYDSAGRQAEVDKPSQSLDEVVQALAGAAPSAKVAPAEPAGDPAEVKAEPDSPPPVEAAPEKPAAVQAKPEPRRAARPDPTPRPEPRPAAEPTPRPSGASRGDRPPESVKLELGGAKRPPALEVNKVEVDPGSQDKPEAKPKPKPAPKPAVTPKPKPAPPASEVAL